MKIILCLFVVGVLGNTVAGNSYGRGSYGAPPPAAPVVKSYAPPQVRSYTAPAPAAPIIRAYSAPAPAAPALSYPAPAPAPRAPAYSSPAPAPAAPLAYGSSYGSSELRAPVIPITRFSHEIEEGKGHRLSFETGHGINHDEHTHVQMNPNALGTPEDALSGKALITKTGTISHTAPEGHRISLQYNADKDGFRATGDHLPVPPTLTPEVAEATRQHLIAFEAAAKAAAAAPEQPLASYGASYGGYAAPAPVFKAPPPPAAAPPLFRSPY